MAGRCLAAALLLVVASSSSSSSSSSCLTWVRYTAETKGAWLPGKQGSSPLGVCRFASLNTEPMGLELGKFEGGSTCYFTAAGPGLPFKVNGTASIADGFDVAVLTAGCVVNDTAAVAAAGDPLPADAVVAGFRADGAALGVCLSPDGEGAGSLLPGQLYLSGGRRGACCWSAGYLEHCRNAGYRVVTGRAAPTPAPTPRAPTPAPPAVPAEPVPALLEPHGRIFSARLSYVRS